MKIKIKTAHKIIGFSAVVLLLPTVYFLARERLASAVTDSCSGVATTFTANAPSSVTAGQSFTVSGITSRPQTSYGVTVTTSTLSISASNATPASYTQAATATDPSPTTGAQTYTATYPNWTLTASGNPGTTIAIKLSSVTANVEGIGSINCSLSATLANVTINAPAATPKSSSSGNSSTSQPNTSTNSTTPTNESNSTQTATSDTQTTSDERLTTIIVKDKNGRPLSGAKVEVGSGSNGYTDNDGKVIFKNLPGGNQTVTVSYKGQVLSQSVSVNDQTDQTIPVALGGSSTIRQAARWAGVAVCSGLLLWLGWQALSLRRPAKGPRG